MGAQLRLRSHFPAAPSGIFAIPYTYCALRFRHSLYAVTYSSSPFVLPQSFKSLRNSHIWCSPCSS